MSKRNRWLVQGTNQNTKEMMVFLSRGECIVQAPGRDDERFFTEGFSFKKGSLRVLPQGDSDPRVFTVIKDATQLRKEARDAAAKLEKAKETKEKKQKEFAERMLSDEE